MVIGDPRDASASKKPSLERYSPYYSDHDALLVTLKLKVGLAY